jgi:two-component system chemotaxis response regulator CheB
MQDAIVVGASAGGIRALKEVLRRTPADLPAAILAVIHIPAHAPSVLSHVLSGAGPLEVKVAESGELPKKGTVYVAPPDWHLLLEGGRLRLTRGPRENRVRPSIDALFRSAAVDLGPRVAGVVLSGTLDDGTAGLWAIKDRGGAALVQQPADAEFPDMPRSALAHVDVDHVLPAAEIGAALAALVSAPRRGSTPTPPAMAAEASIELEGNGLKRGVLTLGQPSHNSCPECHGALVEIRDGSIVRYRCHTGHAYSLRTLLAETEVAIEKSLWNTVRAIEERSFLLRTLEGRARESGDDEVADRYAADASRDEANAQRVREMTAEQAVAPSLSGAAAPTFLATPRSAGPQ